MTKVSTEFVPENYSRQIDVIVDVMPVLVPVTISTKEDIDWLDRLASATRKREFCLDQEWYLCVDRFNENPNINGKICIPAHENGQTVVYDGASIPLPWLISVLTIGILRPLGILLLASIVHDFAFKFGYLWIEIDGARKKVHLERHHADLLFRQIIVTVSGISFVGWIAWFAVRLGWIKIRYAGRPRGGEAPVKELVLGLIILATLSVAFICGDFADTTAAIAVIIFIGWLAVICVNWLKLSRNS